MAFQVSNRDSREIYETAAMMIAKANNISIKDIDKNQLTQGYVETHANLTVNNSLIQWPIVDTQQISQAPITPLMRLLSMQDSFVVGSLSYYLQLYFFTGGNQQSPDYTQFNYFTPITYATLWPNYWQGSTGPLAQQVQLAPGCSMFWSGYLSYEVDKKVIIPYWNCSRHYSAPQTQDAPFNNPVTGVPLSAGPFTQRELDGSTDTFYPVEPTIVLGGGRQNVWKLNLPANIPNIAPFTLTNYGTTYYLKACLKFHGILAQNSTSVK